MTAVVLLATQAAPAVADGPDRLDPAAIDLTMAPGESRDVEKVLHLEALPEKADIIIAIDTTGSMGGAIAQAKTEANAIVNDIKASIPGARFAVVDFRDYPLSPYGSASDFPYLLRTSFTGDQPTVQTAIDAMFASGGNDFPESYLRVFFEAYSDPVLLGDRDPEAEQFLVVLGDAVPHDPDQTTAPACGNRPPIDPGRDGVAGTADDLTTAATIAGLAAANITMYMIRYSSFVSLDCYQQLSAPTGGSAFNAGGSGALSAQIVAAIETGGSEIKTVELSVDPACQLDITFTPPSPYGPVTAPIDIAFTETIAVPAALAGGVYSCTVSARADGAVRATQSVRVTVVSDDVPPECRLTRVATDADGKKFIEVTVHDPDSGIAEIQVTKAVNLTTAIPPFTPGTNDPIVVRATKIDQAAKAQLALRVVDVAGNVTECDPVLAVVVREHGQPVTHTFTEVPGIEDTLRVTNGDPGISKLDVWVNGEHVKIGNLQPGEVRTIDIGAAMTGGDNVISVEARGRPGATAEVLIWEGDD